MAECDEQHRHESREEKAEKNPPGNRACQRDHAVIIPCRSLHARASAVMNQNAHREKHDRSDRNPKVFVKKLN